MSLKKNKCVIIGNDSYLFAGLEKFLKSPDISYMAFDSWNNKENLRTLRDSDIVINFSVHPEFFAKKMKPSDIIDIEIANNLKGSGTRFVFLSSRKVYGTSNKLKTYKETDPLKSFDIYSENKITAENALNSILKDSLCVLRIPNIIGEPILRPGYKTFMGWTTENIIKHGKIVVDQAKETKKDFITKEYLHKTLAYIASNRISGTFNVSSGIPLETDILMTALVGKENIEFLENTEIKEQFVLDNSKITSITGIEITKADILSGAEKFRLALNKIKQ